MKKLLLLAMLAVTFQLASAQDMKKVTTAFLIKRYEDAKAELDKVLADPKQNTKVDVLYYKTRIYSAISNDEKLRDKYPGIAKETEEAFKKYMEADPGFAQVKDKGADGFFEMYGNGYKLGVKAFNEKKWDDAAANFKTAVEYSDIIFKNKWSNASIAFDTTSILYLAYAYQNASKPAEAAKYYGRLADNKIGGEVYLEVYRFLVNHYTVIKDEANYKKYLGIGKEIYPSFNWDEYEIDYMDQNMNLTQKTELYDKEDAAGTLSEMKYLQFGDLFTAAKNKNKELDSAGQMKYTLKSADAYKKAFGKNAQNAIAAFNVGVIYYNIFGIYDDQYAANIRAMQALNADRPVEKDPKKKAAADAAFKLKTDPLKQANTGLEKPLMDNLDQSLEWIEKAYNILKAKATRSSTEKSVINKSVDFLANLYAYKRDRVRGKDPKAYDAFDAKYKEYDGLHAKY